MSTATRGAYAKSHAKRALIARAAYEIVLEVGHRALTTSAVAERAGISERTITSPFLSELPPESVQIIDRTSYDFNPSGGGYGSPSRGDDAALPEIQLSKPSLAKYRVGATVRHPTYGVGKISQISEIGQSTRAVIVFNRVGQKTFILEAARLEVLG